MKDKIQEWQQALENAWNACEFDNDFFIQQTLSVMNEMKSIIDDVEMFEKE